MQKETQRRQSRPIATTANEIPEWMGTYVRNDLFWVHFGFLLGKILPLQGLLSPANVNMQSVAKSFRRPCNMRFTKQMSKFCREINEQREYLTDSLIEPLIRLQALACSAFEVFSYYDPNLGAVYGDAAIQLTVGSHLRELVSIKDTLPIPNAKSSKPTALKRKMSLRSGLTVF
jgi:hypothetical protein